MTPDELARRAKFIGLHGVCITEHNHVWDREMIGRLSRDHGIVVIGGVEVTTEYGDVLVFGLHRPVRDVSRIEDLKAMVDDAGGVMIAAHPFRGEFAYVNSPPTLEGIRQRPLFGFLDGLEVCNGLSGQREREFAGRVASELGLADTGGSDAHAILGIGRCFTAFEQPVSSEEDLIRGIRERRCRGALWDRTLLKK
jgi:predicted metal-dependent phosphoesterase TrpH